MDRLGQHVQQPRLAAPLRRPHHRQTRRVLPRWLQMRRRHPQRDRVQRLRRRQDHELRYLRTQFVQQRRARRRLRIRHRLLGRLFHRSGVRRTAVGERRGFAGVAAELAGDGDGRPRGLAGVGIGLGSRMFHGAAPFLAVAGVCALAAGLVLHGPVGVARASGVAPPGAHPHLAGTRPSRGNTDRTSTPGNSPAFLCQLSAEPFATVPRHHAARPSRSSRSAVTTR